MLGLALSGLPAAALAESETGLRTDVNDTVQVGGVSAGVRASSTAVTPAVRDGDGQEQEGNLDSTSSARVDEEVSSGQSGRSERGRSELFFDLESTTTQAFSFEDLKKSIESRKHELEQEAASSSDAAREAIEDANPVRLAVHTLLASKELLGGVGQRVSEIAKQVNESVATTTAAEMEIQSRGFFSRLFFGGDSESAAKIQEAVAENQLRIDVLSRLLNDANVSGDVQVTLKAQISALEDAQVRLKALAQKEQSQWGLFSWRF